MEVMPRHLSADLFACFASIGLYLRKRLFLLSCLQMIAAALTRPVEPSGWTPQDRRGFMEMRY